MKKTSPSKPTKIHESSGAAVGKEAQGVAPRAIKLPLQTETETGESIALRKERSSSIEARLVQFEYANPSASEVFLVGEFNSWQPDATPMRKQPGGKWSAELRLKPGEYEYRLVVDGQWREDPTAARSVSNPFGELNSVKVVSPVRASEMQA